MEALEVKLKAAGSPENPDYLGVVVDAIVVSPVTSADPVSEIFIYGDLYSDSQRYPENLHHA